MAHNKHEQKESERPSPLTNKQRVVGALMSSLLAGLLALGIYVLLTATITRGLNEQVVRSGVGLAIFTFVVSFAINLVLSTLAARRGDSERDADEPR